ncbi:hypothetical protein K3N28_06230 [Glycomyces sp. TRM65418]|uniref:hypothetical protein n=1 Tax=Glycomyces sp. TRM65418 TaxID=2867006 RepID=UPI001CE5BB64|nr:hypothetical protein [Glycomyces sp. TRM65418]MCC3762665.1 hypothetical protein [Glycomyces sp. TRM65418]QZD56701.1 hypothetical protein K3N28_06180 [Glycomyces sp. TRM65418]
MTATLPTGPILTVGRLGSLPGAAGRYFHQSLFEAIPWSRRWIFDDADIVTAIYLISDSQDRLRWLGQVNRNDGLPGRLAQHHTSPTKRAVFAKIRILHLADWTPPEAIDTIEGRCADLLQIRQSMRPRVWPSASAWPELVV